MHRLTLKAQFTADESGTIRGLAWPFGTPDRIGDVIAPGAFKAAQAPLPMLFAHDPADPVGAWDSIVEKADGLHVSGRLLVNDVARAKEIHALVTAGAVRGLSIGFATKKATARKGGGRTITALDLAEISLCTVPVHPGARITSSKSAAAAIAGLITAAAAALKRN